MSTPKAKPNIQDDHVEHAPSSPVGAYFLDSMAPEEYKKWMGPRVDFSSMRCHISPKLTPTPGNGAGLGTGAGFMSIPKAVPQTAHNVVTGVSRVDGKPLSFGGVVLAEGGKSWSPCYPTTSRGFISTDESPHVQFCKEMKYRKIILSTGRLFNKSAGRSESGFWVAGVYFVSVLHFAPLATINTPTAGELDAFCSPTTSLSVSCEVLNHQGLGDDPGAFPVRLIAYDIETDLGIFLSAEPAPHSINIDDILEISELDGYSVAAGSRLLATGYNGAPTQDLNLWLQTYLELLRDQEQPIDASRISVLTEKSLVSSSKY